MRLRSLFVAFPWIVLLAASSGCAGHGSSLLPPAAVQDSAAAPRGNPDTLESSPTVAEPASTDVTPNLVLNGGAESNVGAASNAIIVRPSDWTTTGQFTAVQYGASGGFPTSTTPGPSNRGKNFFAGGNVVTSTATQTISLSKYSADIDAGKYDFAFSAWIGGYEDQGDNAVVSVKFENSVKATLASASLGPVTPAERSNQTELLYRYKLGTVPKGSTTAIVNVIDRRESGAYNDAYVDDIRLLLKPIPVATPTPSP